MRDIERKREIRETGGERERGERERVKIIGFHSPRLTPEIKEKNLKVLIFGVFLVIIR